MEFTAEVRIATDPIYQKISKVMPEIEWSVHAPYIYRINQLKKEKKCNYTCSQLSNSRNLSRYCRRCSRLVSSSNRGIKN